MGLTAIIDYDAGNTKSVQKAFEYLGEKAVLTEDRNVIASADRVVLPGVGVFGDAIEKIRERELEEVVKDTIKSGKPFLAICVGLQLLFESSEESEGARGLEVFPGRIIRIPNKEGLKVPQMGWNSLKIKEGCRLFEAVPDGSFVYFVHSYYLKADDPDIVAATTEYGVTIHAAVEKGNVFATQFHPEKSSRAGLKILKNFIEIR